MRQEQRRSPAGLRAGCAGGAAGAVAVGATVLLGATGPGPAGALGSLLSSPAGTTADALVADAAALAAWAVAVWLCAGVVLTVLGRLPGAAGQVCDAVARRVTPVLVRRVVGTALGVALTTGAVSGTAGPALAADAPGPTPATVTATAEGQPALPDLDRPSAAPALAALPDLDRPTPEPSSGPSGSSSPSSASSTGTAGTAGTAGSTLDPAALVPVTEASPGSDAPVPATATTTPDAARPAAPAADRPSPGLPDLDRPASDGAALGLVTDRSGATDQVVVVRGDTLWDLARRHLPAGASDAEVSAAWQRWWRANRDVVGPDPDVLLPGQVLRPPRDA